MQRLDLDDLPPKLAQLLLGLEPGEEVLLVRNGVVAGRLVAGAGPEAAENAPEPDRAAEVFEMFRAAIEDEF